MIENVAGAGLDAGRAGLRRDHHLGVDSATGLLIRSPDFLGNLVPSCGYYGLAVTLIPSRAGTEWRRVRFAGEAGFPRYPACLILPRASLCLTALGTSPFVRAGSAIAIARHVEPAGDAAERLPVRRTGCTSRHNRRSLATATKLSTDRQPEVASNSGGSTSWRDASRQAQGEPVIVARSATACSQASA